MISTPLTESLREFPNRWKFRDRERERETERVREMLTRIFADSE